MSKMHGTLDYVLRTIGGHIERVGVWKERSGWKGHAAKERTRRRKANKVAKTSRKQNRS